MLEVISLLGVVKNHLPHPEPGPFGLLATLQLSCQTAPASPPLNNVVLWSKNRHDRTIRDSAGMLGQ